MEQLIPLIHKEFQDTYQLTLQKILLFHPLTFKFFHYPYLHIVNPLLTAARFLLRSQVVERLEKYSRAAPVLPPPSSVEVLAQRPQWTPSLSEACMWPSMTFWSLVLSAC